MASLSYRKKPDLDFIIDKSDSLLRSTKKAESGDVPSRCKTELLNQKCHVDPYLASSRRLPLSLDDVSDKQSVISQAGSEANGSIRKGTDSRWGQFNLSFAKPGSSSTLPEINLRNKVRTGSSLGLSGLCTHHQSISGTDGASSSQCPPSRRSRSQSPGIVGQLDSQVFLVGSSYLGDDGIDLDDSRSVALTERSMFSPLSFIGRSLSMPPPRDRPTSADLPIDTLDIRPVSHQNYLDPDLEKAVNEVLSYKPIKFKRRSLEDSEDDEKSRSNENESRKMENGERMYPTRGVRCSESAVDCRRSSCSTSSHHHGSKSKRKSKKKRCHSSESDSSGDDLVERSNSKRWLKKSQKMSKKKEKRPSSSVSSESDSESNFTSTSDASTISYRSCSSVKTAVGRSVPSPDDEETLPPNKKQPISKKNEKQGKKKVNRLMMKYLYRTESD